MATHIKGFSDSLCSNNCTEISEEVQIYFQCLCCKPSENRSKVLNCFDKIEDICAHLAVNHLQNFIISDLKNSCLKNNKKRQICKFMSKRFLSVHMVTEEEQEIHMKSHNIQSIEICPKCYQGPFGSQNELLSHIGFHHKEMVETWVGKLNPQLNKTLEPIRRVG